MARGRGRLGARHDGRLRLRRHHLVGLAVGSLRQPLSPVLVLWPARPVAAVAAVQHLHALRPVDLRRLLRPRLDRNGATDGEARRQGVRPREGAAGVRLGVHRPPDRRSDRGLRRRPQPRCLRELSAGLLHCRRGLPRSGGSRLAARPRRDCRAPADRPSRPSRAPRRRQAASLAAILATCCPGSGRLRARRRRAGGCRRRRRSSRRRRASRR